GLQLERVVEPRVHRVHDHGCDDHEQLRLVVLPLRAAEQPAENGDIHQEWNPGPHLAPVVIEHARDDEALVPLHVNGGGYTACAEGGNLEARDRERIREVEVRDFRLHVQLEQAVADHFRI